MGKRQDAAAIWMRIDDLAPWAGNPRRNDAAVEPVARSMARFGFGSPILARATDNAIIAGHTRAKAVAFLQRNVWVAESSTWRERIAADGPYVVPGASGEGVVPVRLLDVSAADARALALADNRIGEIAEWDDAALATVLAELRDQDADLRGLGWTDVELDAALRGLVDVGAHTRSPPTDDAPEPPSVPNSMQGAVSPAQSTRR